METIVSRTLSVHKEHEVLLKLEAAGLNDELAQRVIGSKGNDLATKVVRLISNGGYEATTSQKTAHQIMGRNMFGVEEAIQYLGVKPTRAQISALAEVPFTEAELTEARDTHTLVAIFPLSILDIRGKVANNGQRLFYEQDWYNKETFAKYKGEVGWHLVRKTPVMDSTSKTWDDQQKLLGKDEETPKAQVVVYAIIGHFMATGERLFEHTYVRTSSLDSDGSRVGVGDFDRFGLYFDYDHDDNRYDSLGLASSRSSK
ncbi:MAG: hypothetical protein Q8Q95_02340 [bacterium]|nr:hypothetical protein [bacterium]